MGLETTCKAAWDKQLSEGKLQWETDWLLFRGDFRLKLDARQIKKVSVAKGVLTVESDQGKVMFTLGEAAAKWADKINNPPTLLDKFGVKPGQRIGLLNWKDVGFVADLKKRAAVVGPADKVKDCDMICLAASRDADLALLAECEPLLKRNGTIWIVYPKGQKAITELSVMAGAKAAGFVDNKTCKFSATHTGLRVVIPLSRR